MDIMQAKLAVIEAGKKLVEKGLIARTWGNVSCRISENEFVITPSGRSYEDLTPDEIVAVKIDDLSYDGDVKPSSEKGVHASAYMLRPDCNFVIHTHQLNASVVSVMGKDMPVEEIVKLMTLEQAKAVVVDAGTCRGKTMEEVAALLAEGMDAHTELSIICGTNEKLQRSLHRNLQSYSNVHIHGFVKEIPLMMDSADLFLTKPGGISVSEAAVKRLPMVLIDAVSGCESGNLEFFLEKGAAKTANTPEALAALCVDLLKDKPRLSQMAENYGDLSRRDASAVIYQYMIQ